MSETAQPRVMPAALHKSEFVEACRKGESTIRLLRLYVSPISRAFTTSSFARPLRFVLQMALIVFSATVACSIQSQSFAAAGVLKTFPLLAVWITAKPVVFWLNGFHKDSWRFVSLSDLSRLGRANLLASAISTLLIWASAPSSLPVSLALLDLLLCFQVTAGARLAVRGLHGYLARRGMAGGRRVVIYGAGQAGNMLLRELTSNRRLNYCVVGFVDDDETKHGSLVQSLPVLGAGRDLPRLGASHAIAEVFIAISSIGRQEMARLLHSCRQAGLRCKTIPSLADSIEGRALVPQIRDIAPEDLLGRNPVRLDDATIDAKLRGRVVLVTGAAGSIGSEICRQLARFQPKAILGLDAAETPLFYLDREFRQERPSVRFCPIVANIRDTNHLVELFAKYRPSVVYHAAAYKHVPLMESSMISAVENNVLGTFTVATVAENAGVTDFVMISTDKAVRPTSIMGLTKRAAELLVSSLQNGQTKFVSVRFGNVMGSNGSVIPIFKEQIAKRRPVTVTHPEMTRFFMTIPEAAQLVLQASTMGKGGEVLVLDMGDPVSIAELAKTMILMSGLQPGEDIPIEFTGVRPGEKLHEELHFSGENIAPTHHEKIKIFSGPPVSALKMARFINSIRALCAERDERGLMRELRNLVPEYAPSEHTVPEAVDNRQTADLLALEESISEGSKSAGNPVFRPRERADREVSRLESREPAEAPNSAFLAMLDCNEPFLERASEAASI